MKNISLLAILCFVGCQLVVADIEDGPENAVDIITSHGTHIVFPFFSNEVKTINPKLKEYLQEDMKEILDYLKDVIGDQLAKKSPLGIKGNYNLVAAGTKMAMMGRKQDARRKPYQKELTIRSAFNAAGCSMFDECIKMANEYEKAHLEGGPKQYEATKEMLEKYTDDLIEAINSSPVASYVDFMGGRINDESFVEATGKVMAYLKYHGYGKIFSGLSMLLSLIKSLS